MDVGGQHRVRQPWMERQTGMERQVKRDFRNDSPSGESFAQQAQEQHRQKVVAQFDFRLRRKKPEGRHERCF
jgi:hypothetical protein